MRRFPIHLVAAIVITFGLSSTHAQEAPFPSAESALTAATGMLAEGGVEATDDQILRKVRTILDTIINDYPASDIAVKILFQDAIDGLDVAALDRRLLEIPDPDTGADVAVADTEIAPESETPVAQEDTEEDGGRQAVSETPEAAQIVEPVFLAAPFDSSKFEAGVLEMAEELHLCYSRGPLEGGTERQTITFTVSPNGQLDGVPEVRNSAGLVGSGRRTYLNALIAIENCGPYPPRFSGRSYESEFDGVRLTGLIDMSTVEAPWVAATRDGFAALKLNRKAIAEIQGRLEALGFDPNGIDGVMGKGSRAAIASWQGRQGIPRTGYLDARQLKKLNETTEPQFAIWVQNAQNKAKLEKASRPRSSRRRVRRGEWFRDGRGLYCKYNAIGKWCQASRPRK